MRTAIQPTSDEVLGTFPMSTAADVEPGGEAANEAKRGWADVPSAGVGTILDKASRVIEDRMDEFAKPSPARKRRGPSPKPRSEVTAARDIFATTAARRLAPQASRLPATPRRTALPPVVNRWASSPW
ncbi:MAG: aldehyde dehydrogenase family protein [Caldilineaceae bacterium]